MAIEVRRVNPGRRSFKRYVTPVTPPHADAPWKSPASMSRRSGERRLYHFGNQTADTAEAFAAADDEWESNRAASSGST